MRLINETIWGSKYVLFGDRNKKIYKVIIENTDPIINFDNDFIEFPHYIISGNNLKIKKMEDDELEIKGEIKSFRYKE